MISLPRYTSLVPPSTGFSFLCPFAAPASGDCFAVVVAWVGTQTVRSVTDSQNNIYVLAQYGSVGSGATKLNAAIYYCLVAKGSSLLSLVAVFTASTTVLGIGILDLNGADQPIIFDPTGYASASFTGGSDTTTPNVGITLSYLGAISIAVVVCVSGNTMSLMTGWSTILNNLNLGIFWNSLSNNSGPFTVEPATLGASVDSVIVTAAFAAPQIVLSGVIAAPRLPDTFSPRYADDPYDSLSGDPTYVANTNGPQPYL